MSMKVKYIIEPEGYPVDLVCVQLFGYQGEFYFLHPIIWALSEWNIRHEDGMFFLRTPVFGFKCCKL